MSDATAVEEDNTNLSGLVELQQLDLQVQELGKLVQSLPERLAQLEQRLEQERSALTEAEAGLEAADQQRRLLEGEVQDLGEKKVKYKTQLMEVKTNEAYQAMLHEIEFVEQAIAAKEDEILRHMLEADELKAKTGKIRGAFESFEAQIVAERKQFESEAREAEQHLSEVSSAREAIENRVPAELLTQYRRIAAARGGLAVVPLEGDSCQACHVRLRPQVIASLRAESGGMLHCENCSRILYDPKH